MVKRLIDFAGSVCGLTAIMPLVPFIALAIKLESRGPVLVKLERLSAGKIIKIYKFRTMTDNALAMESQLQHLNERKDGPYFKISNDPRVTKVGRWLRKFRIDEFPQLLNVIKGEISLVGPRPYKPSETAQYPESHRHLIMAKAGATGLSQISGSSSLSFQKTLELDDYYLKNQSLWLDIKILAKTLLILFFDQTAV